MVNVSSEAGLVAVPGQVAYNVTKAGLIMLTRFDRRRPRGRRHSRGERMPGHDAHAAGRRGDRGRARPGGA